ncbi:hypothetical protein GYA93_15790 [Gordonia desulfuricans]|uniref:Tail assembly chaperone n=1 Tax=Gordonia desulfuricans TaxID=89051 RepID=A0A7K3LRY3_9ACTN|nr:hypothetical protein [Gordonia desulfuricans]NDK91034.1 hypothetical protein [Gordonia desulfuricans]
MNDNDFDQFEDAPKPAAKRVAKRPAKKPVKRAARPAGAPEPQDRKPKKPQSGDNARRREAGGIEFLDIEVAVKGVPITLAVPAHQGDWPVRAARHFTRGEHIDAIEAVLGEEQWDAFMELNPTINDLNDFGNRLAAELGMDSMGN